MYGRAPVRVLFVETERGLTFVRNLLEGFADAVSEAAEAEIAVRAATFDLVVVCRDVWTEEATALCQRLHGLRLALPVLAVSGPCDARERAAALRAGADDFLAIPFDVEELVARAFAIVRRAVSGSRHVRVGVFSIDLGRREVTAGGQRIALTLREYDLFALLIQRAGEVVTRGELSGKLSGPPGKPSESNAVDVHMSRIRDKLGDHAGAVETVRGVGYRLRQP